MSTQVKNTDSLSLDTNTTEHGYSSTTIPTKHPIYQKKKKKLISLVSFYCFRVLSEDIPTDIMVHVGDAKFPLHKV